MSGWKCGKSMAGCLQVHVSLDVIWSDLSCCSKRQAASTAACGEIARAPAQIGKGQLHVLLPAATLLVSSLLAQAWALLLPGLHGQRLKQDEAEELDTIRQQDHTSSSKSASLPCLALLHHLCSRHSCHHAAHSEDLQSTE